MRLACLACLLAVAAPASAATRTYSVTGFERIRVVGPYAVSLKLGPGGSAVATGDQRAIDRLTVEVRNRTLVVQTDDGGSWGGYGGQSPGRISIAVTTPTLNAAVLNGSGTIAIDRAKAQRFDLVANGSGQVSVGAVQADRMTLSLVGSGAVTLGGRAQNMTATLQGSGRIDAAKLSTDDLALTVSGPGDAHFAAAKTAKVTSTGSGEVTVEGGAACTVNSVGSGEVRCGNHAQP